MVKAFECQAHFRAESEVPKQEMKVYRDIASIQKPFRNPVITIGNFDGVHRGHRALFQHVIDWAKKLGGESVVMTFDPHPLQVLRPGNGPDFITPHARKLELIEQEGIDAAIVVPFSEDFARISAHDFVKDLLVDRIGIKGIVVGYDYRFGRGREGNIKMLRDLGARYGFQVEMVSGIELDGTVVSSTAIRHLIRDGRLHEAESLLGRPYEITGRVVKGKERGRLLGFPTANIQVESQVPPKPGVYAVEVELDGEIHWGAANFGYNPTFGDPEPSLEVHLLDFEGDLYGKELMVRFVERLRDEQRFDGPEALVAQIRKDVEEVRRVLASRRPMAVAAC
ncbi:riboflavin kinase / FMN adenylyltransferase [Desulfacinum infernum DSM 9756]|jgi:riboflavin kinase/FMN adenylyltransferase|uniref:Riboflavin biosynthesis protein n=2 Tax=Desulfacinum infernum TaxID=35837 RepID=A0A1M4ZYD7_9BACT|nr:riboflavin kinase / FMN adenylyltransferase [Desulfacinum infernum DSM 9756]